ncbi:type VII secretion protein EccCa [Gephyromycinifex aptenodytis]|uniref:type VII secretion protein EccCa n=1 Tax=Gephyromycinifex aptenodytis TaxID=2716227 RepID=UPI0014457F15|nr:type VII secretion protein EccCa [Gephyromycinifex aptenodytis]
METVVHRQPRRAPEKAPPRDLVLAAPPTQASTGPGALLPTLLPALGGMGMLLFMVAGRRPLFIMAGLVMVLVTVGGAIAMALSSRTGARKQQREGRTRYLEYLEGVRDELRTAGAAHRQRENLIHPAPSDLLTFACSSRLYERRREDPDSGWVRIGVGALPHPITLRWSSPPNPLTPLDPTCRRAAVALAHEQGALADQPICLPCNGTRSIVVIGRDRQEVLGVARSIVMGLAALHSPEDLRLAVCSPDPELDFARWLPHARAGGNLLVASQASALTTLLGEHAGSIAGFHLVVLADEWGSADPSLAAPGVVVHLLHPGGRQPEKVDVRVEVEAGRARMWVGAQSCDFRIDQPSAQEAEALARSLAGRVRTREVPAHGATRDSHDVRDLLAWSPDTHWRPRDCPAAQKSLLRAAVGISDDGRSLILDLKDAARDGMGPHGLIVGATGSGKSELLRTLVLSLACSHSPQELSFVLVDYKGGATFAGLERLPHTAGSITNLALDVDLVARMRDSLLGEVRRRQQVLAENGHHPDIFAYAQARRADPELPPLPLLLVIIDEFAELLTAEPEFLETFQGIGRIGRSIGIHLLLASQRLDDGRLRGLEPHLSFRIALRTFTTEESRAVLGGPQAGLLPSRPGLGYLRVASGELVRFLADYVSAPVQDGPRTGVHRRIEVLNPGRQTRQHSGDRHREVPPAAPPTPSMLDLLVSRMAQAAQPVNQIWLPPLPARLCLADLDAAFPAPVGALPARIGLVDLPGQQQQEPLDLDIAQTQLAVLGGPRSGRSSALRAVAMEVARRNSPRRVVMHALDLDGEGLRPLAGLPHVGTVARRANPDLVTRVIHELTEILRQREAFGVPAVSETSFDARGEVRTAHAPHILLLLDGYATLRQDHEDLHDRFVELLTRGVPYGIHVVLSAARWHDLRPALQVSIASRLELPLVDPLDSVLDRKLSARLRPDRHPGRAVAGPGRLAQLALPSTLPVSSASVLPQLEAASVAELAAQHSCAASAIRLLPRLVLFEELEGGQTPAPGRIVIGLAGDTLAPVELDLSGNDPHLLLIGDDGSGRTSFLGNLATRLRTQDTLGEVVFALIDPRGGLRAALPAEAIAAYATDSTGAQNMANSLALELADRLKHARNSPAIVCLADDVELVLNSGAPALQPLLSYLPRARELGFHLILARHGGGASRALFDPVLSRIKELGCPGLLLSGDAEEGPLWPRATLAPRPPGRALLVRRGGSPRVIQLGR